MANTIVVKHRSSDTTEPSGLLAGEIAANINASGKKIFIGTGSGNIVFADQTFVENGYQPLDGDLTSIAALAGTSGLLRKTATNTWSLDTASYSTTSHTHPTITWGTGLSGTNYNGSAATTVALDFSELTDKTTAITGATEFILQDGTTESRKAASEIQLSFFNNDSGWTSNTGTVTSVSGTGTVSGLTLSGSVTTSGSLTLGGSISGLTTAAFNAATLVTEGEGLASSDNDTSIPTTAAVIDYVTAAVAGGVTYKGAYNASTNTPDLDTAPSGISIGDMYTVTAAGTFFTIALEVGDVLIAEQNNPTLASHWTIVQRNIIDDQLIDGGTY